MVKFKPLVWIKRDYWIAISPAGSHDGFLSIIFEEGKYYPIWDTSSPGYSTLEEAQAEAQKDHEAYLKSFIEE